MGTPLAPRPRSLTRPGPNFNQGGAVSSFLAGVARRRGRVAMLLGALGLLAAAAVAQAALNGNASPLNTVTAPAVTSATIVSEPNDVANSPGANPIASVCFNQQVKAPRGGFVNGNFVAEGYDKNGTTSSPSSVAV